MSEYLDAEAVIELPPKLAELFSYPRGALRYRNARGGRGSGKSRSFALMAAVFGYAERLRILCTRDIQDSIKESFHAELKAAIESVPWLEDHYDVGVDYIRGKNGTEFMFKGLRHSMGSIKSTSGIDICIVEEAEDVPERAWKDLTPTIRKAGSEIWVIWNPKNQGSPVDKRFVQTSPHRAITVELNYWDNPFFTPELEEERLNDLERYSPEEYHHVWEGGYLINNEACVFAKKWDVREFEPGPDWDGPYHGLDFGFAEDPTAATKSWIFNGCLYIEYDAAKRKLELDDTAEYLKARIPGIEKYVLRADNARPESISFVRRHGLPRAVPVEKGAKSVEDGIAYMRGFKRIYIHPRCKDTIEEFRYYSYKIDRLTGDILPVIVDKWNHCIDSIRYALEPLIKNQNGGLYSAIMAKNKVRSRGR